MWITTIMEVRGERWEMEDGRWEMGDGKQEVKK